MKCGNVEMCKCGNVQVCKCENVQVCKCENVQMFNFYKLSGVDGRIAECPIDHLHIFTFAHLHIRRRRHLHIFTFAHLHIFKLSATHYASIP
jgi:hypothetical protein